MDLVVILCLNAWNDVNGQKQIENFNMWLNLQIASMGEVLSDPFSHGGTMSAKYYVA